MSFRVGVLFVITLILIGCAQQENSMESEQAENPYIQVKNSDPNELQELTNSQIATHLANLAADVPEVNNATAVVAGPYAVVGIDVDKDLDRNRVGTIKYTVLEALYHDPYGKTAVVVADADATERIRGMAEEIRQGHPVEGFVDELSAIVGRYMPDFPIRENVPEQPDQNKEVLPKDKERELENIQEEQSNQRLDNNQQ
ncbi:YhcN/YlaJ family sporulation lipoprotein [Oceanobacillus piezotolerans]|uniref:YhcN/YlaJ family sporulation lipoprotein n=1 Tax=Oceanobacillus piezotolerans TaxID=2448030 RepID=A0A498D994_9BACI|nr:YhcN/YlaJ family sporulation lipoprotein [Oceanobacillus piezotolerans]RLL45201.1 YhcN/YlaJ family sporulation lipoprotein [Oceanobacillus piezotolerans]